MSHAEHVTLSEALKNHTQARVRARAHAILLSNRHYKMNAIADIYQTDRDTISHWLAQWEARELIGLYDEPRSGRPVKLTPTEITQAHQLIHEQPRSMKCVAAQLKEHINKIISLTTLRRLAKQLGLVWKRIRKSLKPKRDEIAFQQAQAEIAALQTAYHAGHIELYYFDETDFSLNPLVPYAWQPKGKTLGIVPSHSQRLNVLGFFNLANDFFSFVFQGKVDTLAVVACFEAFRKTIKKPTWIILDNAAQHTANFFKSHLTEWEQHGLFIKYLPPYSPELNLIEILWRFIKYTWLPFSAYLNITALKNAVDTILENIGIKYRVTFG